MAEVLLSGKGEASGVALASRLLAAYGALPAAERPRFFELLADRFGPDLDAVQRAIEAFVQAPVRKLRRGCTPSRSLAVRS